MFLEQLIDFLCWCVRWLITEMRCPSRQRREERQPGDGQAGNEDINLLVDTNAESNFYYKEFPHTIGSENEQDNSRVLISPVVIASNSTMANGLPEFCFSWLFPHKSDRGPLLPSIARSFPTCATILVSAIAISGISGFFAYLDMETTDKCTGIESHRNNSIPIKVLKWKLIGESFQALLLNFWFPATVALLFNGRVFLRELKSLLCISLIMGLLVVIYKAYLYIYHGSHFKDSKYRYPGNAIFFIGIIISCIPIARVTRQSTKSIAIKIGQIIIFSLLMYWGYRYWIVPWFNKQTSDINRAMIATILPVFSLIPVAVGKYIGLCHCTTFVEAEVSFVLIYFNYLIPVVLYRIMQAELTDLGLFVAFSVIHGVFNLIAQLTRHFRENLWGCALRRFRSFGWRPVPYCSSCNRRLQADLEIQDMLSQFTTVILSQLYMMLYCFTTFNVSLSDEIKKIYARVLIGLAIEFVFAWLSTFIQIWLYNIAIKTVWYKSWLRHILANVIMMVVAISYFSKVLLSILELRIESNQYEYNLRNCTMPFTYK